MLEFCPMCGEPKDACVCNKSGPSTAKEVEELLEQVILNLSEVDSIDTYEKDMPKLGSRKMIVEFKNGFKVAITIEPVKTKIRV